MSARNSIAGILIIAAALAALVSAQGMTVSDLYRREFQETVPRPAIYDNPKGANCKGERYITSVTSLRVSDVRSELLILQLNADGTVKRRARRRALTPSGRFRVLTFLVQYPETLGTEGERMWRAAQESINAEHKSFAEKQGYASPLIVFDNTNLLVSPSEIDPLELDALQKHAEQKGIKVHEFDIFMAIDLNPKSVAGGLARSEPRSVYVGNYGRWTAPLNEKWWRAVAATAYHHETGHLWGWEHDWISECPQPPDVPQHKPFITDPALFGWVDLDGDTIPEINDPSPYGRR